MSQEIKWEHNGIEFDDAWHEATYLILLALSYSPDPLPGWLWTHMNDFMNRAMRADRSIPRGHPS